MSRAAILAFACVALVATASWSAECPEGTFEYAGTCMNYPALKKEVPAVYPKKAKKAGITGEVQLWVTVGTNGRIENPKVQKESPPGWGFGDAAKKAAKQRKYEPAMLRGKPTAVSFALTTTFSQPIEIPSK